jgi:phosphatidylglycerophosphatase C
MNRRIAFFDFDGTITTKDTLLEFIKFSKGPAFFWLGFLLTSPWMLAMKLKLISNQQAKEKVLAFFFSKTPLSRFQEQCEQFSGEILPGLIRPKALHEIALLKEKGTTVVIVSASPQNWIQGWAGRMQAELIATRLEMIPPGTGAADAPADTPAGEYLLTGKIEGANCHGREKVRRIEQAYTLADYAEIYAYGDSGGDKPMLQLGTASFYKPFR